MRAFNIGDLAILIGYSIDKYNKKLRSGTLSTIHLAKKYKI